MSVTFDPTTYTTNERDILNVTLKASIPASLHTLSLWSMKTAQLKAVCLVRTSLAEMTHVTYLVMSPDCHVTYLVMSLDCHVTYLVMSLDCHVTHLVMSPDCHVTYLVMSPVM